MTSRLTRAVIVPGLAVSRYAVPAAQALTARGVEVSLEVPPGAPGRQANLRAYGDELAGRLQKAPVDLLIGLSVGAQAAAVAAAQAGSAVGALVLVSPTVAPELRGHGRLLARWARAGRAESPALLLLQAPEWSRAGLAAIGQVLASTGEAYLEDTLPSVAAPLTVVHAADDLVCPHAYAAQLAAAFGGRLIIVPRGTHSWPYRDAVQFARLMEGMSAWQT